MSDTNGQASNGDQGYTIHDSGQREQFDTGAVRDVRTGKGRYDLLPPEAIRRWAQVMERGATKYGDRNWERGMPIERCLDSALRHIFQHLEGLHDEDHLGHAMFNIGAAMTFQERDPGITVDELSPVNPNSTFDGGVGCDVLVPSAEAAGLKVTKAPLNVIKGAE